MIDPLDPNAVYGLDNVPLGAPPPEPRLLDQAIAQLDALPEGVNLGVHADGADVGAEIAGKAKVGEHVTIAADATWYRRAGYTVMGWIGWSPK